MIRSASSQEDESVFLDEGKAMSESRRTSRNSIPSDEESTVNTMNCTEGKTDSFFAENYDHEHLTENLTIEDDPSARPIQRRKSVSSRFRSVSKEVT